MHVPVRHISKYYTEDVHTRRNWVKSDTGQRWIAPAAGRDGSTAPGQELAAGETSSSSNDSNDKNPGTRGSGRGECQGGQHFLQPVSLRVACNLVKPLHPSALALPSPSSPIEGVGASEQLQQQRVNSTECRNKVGKDGTSTLTSYEAALAIECPVSLSAVHGTTSGLVTCAKHMLRRYNDSAEFAVYFEGYVGVCTLSYFR